MIGSVHSAAACLFAAVGSLAAAGCVNDYLYGEGAMGTSTTAASDEATDASTTAGADASTGEGASGSDSTTAEGGSSGSSSSSSSGGNSGDSDPTASTIGDGGASSSGGDATLELCQGPCDANAMCGAEPDLCVDLTEGNPVCLRDCGRACPDGFTCQMRVSVEGPSGEQCVPDGNICP